MPGVSLQKLAEYLRFFPYCQDMKVFYKMQSTYPIALKFGTVKQCILIPNLQIYKQLS